jgi:hypothetical protein
MLAWSLGGVFNRLIMPTCDTALLFILYSIQLSAIA